MLAIVVSQSNVDPVAVQLAEHIRRHFGQQGPMIATFSNYERMLMQMQPQVVAVVLPPDPERGLEVMRNLRRIMSGTIVAVGVADSKLIMRALHEGAVQYLDATDLETGVLALLSRRREKEETAGTVQGKLIALLGSCGGCGASTLAVNLAAVLAKDAGCALVDLKAGRGDLSPLLDLRPTFTLAHLCENTTRLDRAMFEKLLVRHKSGIHLLGAPPRFGDSRRVTAAGVEQALRLARSLFPAVVVDLEDCFHEEQIQALKQAEDLLLVCRLEFTSLRNARRMQDYLVEHQFRGKIHFVINRFGQPGELPVDEAQDALGAPLVQFVADDPKTVNSANNMGVPAVLQYPATKVAQSLKQLARQFTQSERKSKEMLCVAAR